MEAWSGAEDVDERDHQKGGSGASRAFEALSKGIELEDLRDRTRMVMTHIGVPADSPGGQGWAMAIDKLDARVKELHDGRTRL